MAWFGINNDNEFYSQHYLSEIFQGDVRGVIDDWQQKESLAREQAKAQPENTRTALLETALAPWTRLNSVAKNYLQGLAQLERIKNPQHYVEEQRALLKPLLGLLGYSLQPQRIHVNDHDDLPILGELRGHDEKPLMWILEAVALEDHQADPLSVNLQAEQYLSIDNTPVPKALADNKESLGIQQIISQWVFSQNHPPRWVLLVSARQWLLIDRTKFVQSRLLRFDWVELLTRRESDTLKAACVLLAKDSILDSQGQCLLDNLDENAHKHAYGVSEDLKYAIREAIELLGNEAAQQWIEQKRKHKERIWQGELDSRQLSMECLRYMYRLLFLFYIEARPELGYAPVDSKAYLKGYSLESLRELEMVPLSCEAERKGRFLHDSLQTLFKLIRSGYQPTGDLLAHNQNSEDDSFTMQGLMSHLFDPDRTKLINRVAFSNETLQKVIQLMSLTRPTTGRKRRGRISYAQLGINQLGAVYEALLSYRGFFAEQDLYEVKKKGEKPTDLDTGYFVGAEDLEKYDDDEKVMVRDEHGDKKLRVHPQGSFIYRLAGRDRAKSASYYTPEVLTQCLVKYALKELFAEQLDPLPDDITRAEHLLQMTVCEPAMGSAAFLNEAINQLADKYLELIQSALGKRIPHSQYMEEKQKVKMYLADNCVYGVDLNPVAAELAEVSLWLNAISKDRFVPWFGLQLFCGNSLIGARREVYREADLSVAPSADNSWLNTAPQRVTLNTQRKDNEFWHFLLPAEGMVAYNDKVIRGRYPQQMQQIKDWRNGFIKRRYDKDDLQRIKRLSEKIDELWDEHTQTMRELRAKTTDPYSIFGHKVEGEATSLEFKDQALNREILSDEMENAGPFKRLKLAMDYWCALWFWPIDEAELLPDRNEFLFDLENLLLGDTMSSGPVGEVVDLFAEPGQEEAEGKSFVTRHGKVMLDKLFQFFPRLKLAHELASKHRFFHWELCFADIFADKGGFDLILGNPPWLKVEWEEKGVLGDHVPLFVLTNHSAPELNQLRSKTFEKLPKLEDSWRNEFEEAAGTQKFLNGICNYPLLKGIQANLYKCFIPQAWKWGNNQGVSGFLHPEGIYDDPKGGKFRSEVFPRLKSHFQFENELTLFADVDHHTKFSVNVYYASKKKIISIQNISNLYFPGTIDQCFNHDGAGPIPGIKTDENNWNIVGHENRVIKITIDTLSTFSELYDKPNTPANQSSLPSIHVRKLMPVLEKFLMQEKHLSDLKGNYYSIEMWHETNAQKDKTIKRQTKFSEAVEQWVLSGPHFFVGNPFYKTPREKCTKNSHYDILDLTIIPEDYFPRTNYTPECKVDEYNTRTPKVPWMDSGENQPKAVTDYYRFINRRMFGDKAERSMICTIIPPKAAHIHPVLSTTFANTHSALSFLGFCQSIIADFYLKTTGKADVYESMLQNFPIVECKRILIRTLGLNCLTNQYAELWKNGWLEEFRKDQWSVSTKLLNPDYYNDLREGWKWEYALRSDYERRQALIEIDVLVSQSIGLTLEELLIIYRVQFSVMKQYEKETFYDTKGRTIFTSSKGLVGIGLPRKARKADPKEGIFYSLKTSERTEEKIALGWKDICDLQEGIVTKTFMDDTLPDGPKQRTIEYHAPFYRPDREQDYITAWKVFSERFANEKKDK